MQCILAKGFSLIPSLLVYFIPMVIWRLAKFLFVVEFLQVVVRIIVRCKV